MHEGDPCADCERGTHVMAFVPQTFNDPLDTFIDGVLREVTGQGLGYWRIVYGRREGGDD